MKRDYNWKELQELANMDQQKARKYIWDEFCKYWIKEGEQDVG